LFKTLPFVVIPEIVHIQEPAAEKILAEGLGLGFGQFPVAYLAGDQSWPVVEIVQVIGVRWLFHGTGVHTAEAAYSGGEVAVCAGIVLGPTGAAFAPVAAESAEASKAAAAAEAGVWMLRIHQARLNPFGLLVPVGWHGNVVIAFEADI